MGRWGKFGLGTLGAALLMSFVAPPRAVEADYEAAAQVQPGAVAADGTVTLLSYNVEGLPWPFTHGRPAAAARIAAQLRALRERGAQPQVVAVQEAFGDVQKGIGAAAGYRYAAFGPSAGMRAAAPATADERAFLSDARTLRGETEGAWEDSGLAVFSDYPIAWVKRMPFPRYACAGYDCLANKGILVVGLRVPGRSEPLVVVDTHLNSRTASGVGDGRSFAAYRRQVDLLGRTVAELGKDGSPVMLAGDFNVGNDPERGAYLAAALTGSDRMQVGASETACGGACRIVAATPGIAHSKTIIFYRGPEGRVGAGRSFGSLPDGDRLSDHIGVMQAFALDA